MPGFLAPLLPLAIRFGPRFVLLATAAWTGARLAQSRGNPQKTFEALRSDIVRAYQFFTGEETRKLKDAGDTLKQKGGDIAIFANALLALIEFVSGVKLTEAKKVITQTKTVLDAYGKLSPADKGKIAAATTINIPAEVQNALAKHLFTLGLQTLNSTNVVGMSKPAEFLCQKYTGLFYIGRSGNQLTAEEVDTVASTMLHLHSMADTPDQALLIEWYTTVDETITGENLIERLKKCPEVTALGFDVRYIAYALHQSVPGLDFGPLDDELIKRLQ